MMNTMPRSYGPMIDLVVRGRTYTFTAASLEGFPDATAFLDGLASRESIAAAVCILYVKLAAKLKRQGRLHMPEILLTQRVERTAARAYWKWVRTTYDARVRPVLLAFANDDVRRGVQRLRVSSIVPPSPDKKLYRRTLGMAYPGPGQSERGGFEIEPCPDQWTLHVPIDASIPWHTDPCIDQCDVVKIQTPEQLEAVRIAIEKAWGHSDLSKLPRDAFLFGQPPLSETPTSTDADQKVVALTDRHTKIGGGVEALGGSYATQPDIFATRLQAEPPTDVVVIDFSATPYANAEAVLIAVHTAWARWNETRSEAAKLAAAPVLPKQNIFEVQKAWSELPPPQPAGPVAAAPVLHVVPSGSHVTAFGAPTFVPTDWAARDRVAYTRLVHCAVCKTTHSVGPDDPPCAEGAWTAIPT